MINFRENEPMRKQPNSITVSHKKGLFSNNVALRFELRDPVLWKAVSEDAIQSMRSNKDISDMQLVLNPNLIDPYHTASNLEHQLKR